MFWSPTDAYMYVLNARQNCRLYDNDIALLLRRTPVVNNTYLSLGQSESQPAKQFLSSGLHRSAQYRFAPISSDVQCLLQRLDSLWPTTSGTISSSNEQHWREKGTRRRLVTRGVRPTARKGRVALTVTISNANHWLPSLDASGPRVCMLVAVTSTIWVVSGNTNEAME